MATISTSIELYDKVSAPIYKMLGAIDNLTSAFESVEASMDGSFDTSQIEAARRATEQAALDVVRLGNEIEENEKSQKDFNRQVRNGASDMDDLANKVMGMIGAYASIQGIIKLANLSDEYVQTNARLNMINDGLQSSSELQEKILQSAQRSRAAYTATADAVAKLSLNAKDAFSSNDETIQFAENLNKLFAIAGTEQASIASATLQLTQALGSGVLRGEEFNAVFEAAPNIMQTVADYMGVPIGSLRAMAQEGQITADVVKNALLSATDKINAQFEQMPMTWGQVWTGIMNELYVVTAPTLELISLLAQNWSVIEPIVIGLATAIGIYTAALLTYNAVQGISTLLKNIDAAATMLQEGATFAATAAQYGFNAALLACPLTWIIACLIAVIAIIYAVIAAINKIQGTSISATGVIVGALMVAVAFVGNLFVGLWNMLAEIFVAIYNLIAEVANFIGNVFTDPIGSVVRLFVGFADTVLGIIQAVASAIDAVFGSDLAGGVQGWRDSINGWVDDTFGKGDEVMAQMNADDLKLGRFEYGEAYDLGYSWGEGIDDSVSSMSSFDDAMGEYGGYEGYDASQIPSNIADTAGNTGAMKDSMDITSEDLKYLRDIAETEVVNRFTTAEIKVEMNNNNTISSDMDLDGVVEYLVIGVNEAMEKAAEGVHE